MLLAHIGGDNRAIAHSGANACPEAEQAFEEMKIGPSPVTFEKRVIVLDDRTIRSNMNVVTKCINWRLSESGN
jgi:hypothetical protein